MQNIQNKERDRPVTTTAVVFCVSGDAEFAGIQKIHKVNPQIWSDIQRSAKTLQPPSKEINSDHLSALT